MLSPSPRLSVSESSEGETDVSDKGVSDPVIRAISVSHLHGESIARCHSPSPSIEHNPSPCPVSAPDFCRSRNGEEVDPVVCPCAVLEDGPDRTTPREVAGRSAASSPLLSSSSSSQCFGRGDSPIPRFPRLGQRKLKRKRKLFYVLFFTPRKKGGGRNSPLSQCEFRALAYL